MSRMDDELDFLDDAYKGILIGFLLLPIVVGAMLGGLRWMEKGICESYAGNSYSIWEGKCTWPPLSSQRGHYHE